MGPEKSDAVMGNMVRAVTMLEQCAEFSYLMPEVRVNLAYALPEAGDRNDVVAIDGRITVVKGYPRASGLPKWGASDHMSRLLIEVRKYDPSVSAGINFKCDANIIEVVREYCEKSGLSMGSIDRTKEPVEVLATDGASMPWKIKQLLDENGRIPRIFYEGDGWGKEPLFVAIGSDAVEVTGIAMEIARSYCREYKGG